MNLVGVEAVALNSNGLEKLGSEILCLCFQLIGLCQLEELRCSYIKIRHVYPLPNKKKDKLPAHEI